MNFRMSNSRRFHFQILFISLFFPVLLNLTLHAQQRIDHFQVFDDTNGLVKAVVSVTQDKQGFLWFGTEGNNGVFRYDGINFQQYRHDPQNENSIVPGNIYSIITDRSGRIWFASNDSGLSCFDPEKNLFTNYSHLSEDDNSPGDNRILSLLEDRQGNIWIASAKSLDKFSPDDGIFSHYLPDPEKENRLSSSLIYHLHESRDGKIWIATYGGGLNMFDPDTEMFTVYKHDPVDSSSLSDDVCGAVIEDRDGYIWVGGKSGLNRLDRKTGRFSRYLDTYVWDIVEDGEGNFWLGGFGGGLAKFNRTEGLSRQFARGERGSGQISSDLIFFVFEDRGGVLWAGTVDGGLNKYTELNEQFSHFGHIEGDGNSFYATSLFSIYQTSDGIIWLGGQGHQSGLNLWDRHSGVVDHIIPGEDEGLTLPPKEIISMYEDDRENLYLGQWGGVVRYDRSGKKFERIFPPPVYSERFSDKMVRNIIGDRNGDLWLATEGGLFKLDNDRNLSEVLFEGISISTLLIDTEDNFWIGTSSEGIKLLSRETGRWIEMINDPDDAGSISNGEIKTIHQDSKGRIWIGATGGLNLWRGEPDSFLRYGRNYGFVSDSIFSILEDESGNLWMGTSAGLVRFDPDSLEVGNFTVSDGIQGNEFSIRNDGAMIGDDGLFYFIGKNGLTQFDPRKIQLNDIPPQVVLTSFRKYNLDVGMGTSIGYLENLDLTWEDKMISFEFAALDYANPQQNQYAYMLEGFDRDWIPAGNSRLATYTNLEGGEYVFRVKASNNHGIWNEEGISLPINIIPPWWKSSMFYTLLAAAILFFMATVIFYVLKLLNEIGEHDKSDKALKKLQSFLTNIINSMPSVLVGIDDDFRITQWNTMAEEKTEISSAEALSKDLFEVLPGLEPDRESISKSLHTRAIKEIRKISNRKGFDQTYENIMIYPLAENGIAGAVIRIDDISEQMRMQEIMLQSEKMMSVGGLAAGMAHEINNPLGGLLQTVSVLKRRLSDLTLAANRDVIEEVGLDPDKFIEYLEKRKIITMLSYINESGRRIADIVRNMLTFSRKSEGRTTSIDIRNVLESTVALAGTDYSLKKKHDFKNIKIIREYDSKLPLIIGQSSKLQQVFLNIIKNSSQAMQEADIEDPEIKLRTLFDIDNSEAVIEIEDNGPGMNEEVRKRIFEPFYTTKPQGFGTGLGMSVSYFIIKDNHKGEMTVKSTPGQGACFSIRLPVESP